MLQCVVALKVLLKIKKENTSFKVKESTQIFSVTCVDEAGNSSVKKLNGYSLIK